MKRNIIFVTGFFGAPVMESAERLAKEKGYGFLSLDAEIEKEDGRSIQRICMMMGEHEYRNKEYAMLSKIVESAASDAVASSACDSPADVSQNAESDSVAHDAQSNSRQDFSPADAQSNTRPNSSSADAQPRTGNPTCDASLYADKPGLVVCCGDGVLLDEMSKALIKQHSVLIIGSDLPQETLWQNAQKDKNTYHAFMHFGTEEKRRTLFNALLEKQRALFAPLL